MAPGRLPSDRSTLVPLAVYYVVLAGFAVGAFFPGLRIWGLSWWAYFPEWVPLMLLLAGIVIPLGLIWPLRVHQSSFRTDDTGAARQKWFGLVSLGLVRQ